MAQKMNVYKRLPIGIQFLHNREGRRLSYNVNKFLVLVITFLCYMGYHAARKPPSVVKSVLRGDTSIISSKDYVKVLSGWAPFNGENGESLLGEVDLAFLGTYAIGMFFSGHICDQVDLRAFLTAGMIGSGICVILHGLGYFANCHALVYYLVVSVLGGLFQSTGWPSVVSAVANWCGKGKRGLVMGVWNVHTSLGNILGTMVAAWGLSVGWGWSFVIPGVILLVLAVVVHCFLLGHPDEIGYSPSNGAALSATASNTGGGGGGGSRGRRTEEEDMHELRPLVSHGAHGSGDDGMTMALSSSSSSSTSPSLSAVTLSVSAAAAAAPSERKLSVNSAGGVSKLLGNSQLAPSLAPAAGGASSSSSSLVSASTVLAYHLNYDATAATVGRFGHPHRTVRFIDAWRIPGVASYAFCLFFSKLVAYTFLYWLPFYIRSAPIADHMLSAKEAGELSILFDIGGVAGGILAGHLSDRSGASAAVACSFTLLSVPCLYLYRTLGHSSYAMNAALLLASGFFVNGPYALITTAVSADLGTHESLQGCATALATVSAIIDGMGSVGAALGPMLTGIISSSGGGFDRVFAMLYTSAAAAGALLIRLVAREIAAFREAGLRKDFL